MKNKTIYIALGTLALGILLGWVFFGGSTTEVERYSSEKAPEHQHPPGELWTCSMHPQIRQSESGQCPICAMDLVTVNNISSELDTEDAVQMTPAAMQLANVQTVRVERTEPTKEIHLSGRVEADERRIADITAHFNGRIEQLYVNYTGQEVKQGQVLANVYSPDLVTAQKELFEAAKFRQSNPSFFEAAVNKLKLWDLSDKQIENILKSGVVQYNFDVLAHRSGTIVSLRVKAGEHIYEGHSMFELANLERLWVVFEAYESDLPWIQLGDEVRFSVPSLPGQTFRSKVTFINPIIDAERRVAEVRTEVQNLQYQLKPQMFAKGVLESSLPGTNEALLIPKTAVLWTGKRAVIYVKRPDLEPPTFAYREIVLGPETGNHYVVNEGLEAGEEVVVNGVFKVDAAAQLQGKISMMNPRENEASASYDHGEVEGESSTKGSLSLGDFKEVPAQFQQQLAEVLKPYLNLKNSLVDSDEQLASEAASQVASLLKQVDRSLLSEIAYDWWTGRSNTIQQELSTIQSSPLEAQRQAFAQLSQALYHSLQQFGVTGSGVYYQYCPMAENNTGAFWLSEQKEIRNPYFGKSMLSCGETREILE
ncbi:MAG: efflux RND transporter periplasmic adaptor subunit [Bacteroidota bacterium]